jgi:hypothetical protein
VNFNPKWSLIAQRLLDGEPKRTIAFELGISESSLTRITSSPLFVQQLKSLDAVRAQKMFDANAACREHAQEATEILVDLLRNPSLTPNEKRGVANDILRLGGYDKRGPLIQQNFVKSETTNISFEQRLRQAEQVEDGETLEALDAVIEQDPEQLLESHSDILALIQPKKEDMN